MLRVNVGLSRKLSKDYNSNGFSVNIDGEVTAATNDLEAVMEQVKELFDLAEEALDLQVERSQGEAAIASRDIPPTAQPVDPSVRQTTSTGSGPQSRSVISSPRTGYRNGSGSRTEEEPATNKQINYLLSIGKRQRLSTTQLEKRLAEMLGRPVGLYDLSKQSAAFAIEQLTSETPASRN